MNRRKIIAPFSPGTKRQIILFNDVVTIMQQLPSGTESRPKICQLKLCVPRGEGGEKCDLKILFPRNNERRQGASFFQRVHRARDLDVIKWKQRARAVKIFAREF